MSWPIAPAAVALDALEDRERPLAARLVADDPTFRAEVDRLRATASALTTLDRTVWEPVPPPPLGDVAPAAEGAALRRRRRARPRFGVRPRLLVAASGLAAAAAALVIALVLTRGDGATTSTTLALHPLPGVSGRASLTLSGAAAELRGSDLPPSGAHDYYEAWLADARGRMVSMGTFRVGRDGRVDAHMAVAVDVSRYALVDVSLEPDDGNPGHSDTSVLRAKL